MTHQRKIVGDEEVAHTQVSLQLLQEVQDLGLDGEIQGAGRLVADKKLRADDQGPGNGDTLPLAT